MVTVKLTVEAEMTLDVILTEPEATEESSIKHEADVILTEPEATEESTEH